jgi:hypothetical protein
MRLQFLALFVSPHAVFGATTIDVARPYAYSGNLGWIDFGWALASDPNRACFDLFTGQFPSLRIAAISQVSGFSVTTLECPTRGTRLYTVETNTTLLPGSWSSLGYFAGTGFLSAYNHNTVVESKRFYRLGSKLPALP